MPAILNLPKPVGSLACATTRALGEFFPFFIGCRAFDAHDGPTASRPERELKKNPLFSRLGSAPIFCFQSFTCLSNRGFSIRNPGGLAISAENFCGPVSFSCGVASVGSLWSRRNSHAYIISCSSTAGGRQGSSRAVGRDKSVRCSLRG